MILRQNFRPKVHLRFKINLEFAIYAVYNFNTGKLHCYD